MADYDWGSVSLTKKPKNFIDLMNVRKAHVMNRNKNAVYMIAANGTRIRIPRMKQNLR